MKNQLICILSSFLILLFLLFHQAYSATSPISNPSHDAKLPYLTKDNLGNFVLCWTEENDNGDVGFYFSVSNGPESNFTKVQSVPVPSNIKVHHESIPKLAFKKDGSIWAFFQTSEPGGHFSSEVRYTISKDGGKTWRGNRIISKDSTSGKSRSFFDVSVLKDGEIGIVWLDQKLDQNKGRPVFFTKTKNMELGETVVIDSQACECCRTDIVCDEKGNIHIAYRDLLEDGSRDMSYVTSSDGGKTFTSPLCISNDKWKIEGCPHSGPALGSLNSMVYVAWYTGKESEKGVYYSTTIDGQFRQRIIVSENRNSYHPQLSVLDANNAWIVWEESTQKGEQSFHVVKAKLIGQTKDRPDKTLMLSLENTPASFPVVFHNRNKTLVAWQQLEGEHQVIRFATLN